MNEIQIFNNSEFGEIRTIMINGEPYFVGKDIAVVLGYSNPPKAIRDHVDEEDKTVNDLFTVNGTHGILINESGLYSLIFSSKLPTAKSFKRWVTSEVLPTIRKTGSYKVPVEEEVSDDNEKQARAKMAQKLLEVSEMYGLPKKYKALIIMMATQIMSGEKVLQIEDNLQKLEESEKPKTYLAGDIARMCDTTAYQIGCIANVLGMKNQEYGEWYYYTRPTDNERIRAFKYNEKAVEKFRLIFETIEA